MEIHNIEYLTFSVGSFRGIAHIKSVQLLQEIFIKKNLNWESQIKGSCGISVGSLAAFLVSFNCDMKKAFNLFYNVRQEGISIINPLKFCKTIQKLFCTFNIPINTTFRQSPKILKIAAYNITTHKLTIFSNRATPNITILSALLASCAIPIIFKPVKIGKYYYVDGGVNVPLALHEFPIHKTLGIYLYGNNENYKKRLNLTKYEENHVVAINCYKCKLFEHHPTKNLDNWLLTQTKIAINSRLSSLSKHISYINT